ncbi:hypothetical protein Q9233_012966 [Columba guinea]|nr:hypothetical protein Q9233_012966 [Columba guinea]
MGSSGLDRDACEVAIEGNGLLHRCLVQVIPVQVSSLEMSPYLHNQQECSEGRACAAISDLQTPQLSTLTWRHVWRMNQDSDSSDQPTVLLEENVESHIEQACEFNAKLHAVKVIGSLRSSGPHPAFSELYSRPGPAPIAENPSAPLDKEGDEEGKAELPHKRMQSMSRHRALRWGCGQGQKRGLNHDDSFLNHNYAFLHHDDVFLHHDDAFLHHDGAFLNHHDVLLNHDNAFLNHNNAFLNHDDAFLNHDEAFRNLEDAFLNHDDVFLNRDDAFLNLEDAFRHHDDAFLNHDGVFLNHDDAFLNHDNAFLNHNGAFLHHDDAFLNHDDAFLNHDNAFLHHDGVFLTHEERLFREVRMLRWDRRWHGGICFQGGEHSVDVPSGL